ncbi:hypothetical protein, partial [Polaribacter porphyrae]|uniref:hypothetical protein n=1 Tax=Polaribacter porphyrae TaxID=1137780 RepID=UPI001B80722F
LEKLQNNFTYTLYGLVPINNIKYDCYFLLGLTNFGTIFFLLFASNNLPILCGNEVSNFKYLSV